MTPGNWTTLGIFLVTLILSAVGAYYGFVRSMDRRVAAIENRCMMHQQVIDSIATLNTRLDKVANDGEVFWKVIGPHLANVIHSPKSVDRDELVERLTHGTISKDELPVLIELLHKAIGKNEWTSEKKFAGILLLARATALFNDATYERRMTA
jgi:hypothetical protein